MNIARQKQLEEDLLTLWETLGATDSLSPRKVRLVASATVRKWILDGQLNLLAKQLGVRLELPTLDTSGVFDAIARTPEISYFLAGGVEIGGIPIRSVYCSRASFGAAPPIPVETKIRLATPGRFLSSRRLYFKGFSHSAEHVLLFVSNKFGGVHLDFNRTPIQANLEEAAAYVTIGNPDGETTPRLIELADAGGPCRIVIPSEGRHVWSALEIELLAAAQSLVNVHVDGARLLSVSP